MDWNQNLEIDDLNLLIEILQQWEVGGDCEKLEMIQSLKTLTVPTSFPDEVKEKVEEALDGIKKELLPKETETRVAARQRREKATLLRAKLMIMRMNMLDDTCLKEDAKNEEDAKTE